MKNRRLLSLLLCLSLATIPLLLLIRLTDTAYTQPETPDQPVPMSAYGKIDAPLTAKLSAGDDDPLRFIIHLRQTADLRPATLPVSVQSRRETIVDRLQQTAVASQAPLRAQLDSWQAEGLISTYHPFWIINAIAATGTAAAVEQLAARPDVARIQLDAAHRYFDPPPDSINLETPLVAGDAPTTTHTWGLARIGALNVWHGLGITGEGVTIALMDSGVDWQHPDLFPNYRGNQGNGVIDHAGNWYHTSIPTKTVPTDTLGHGTHVAGTAAGQNGIGVAPGANWIAVSIADDNGFIFESDVHAGFEWLLAPNGDPSLAPDVVNNSWGGDPLAETFVADVEALHAAGIITVFAAGNTGPFTGTIQTPGGYTGTLSVAASDEVDTVTWFSSRGPSPLTDEQNPWIAAPGVDVLSALPGGQYGHNNGTSMATPHVAGAIALLLSANPNLSQQEIAQILADTAVPLSPSPPDIAAGWGRLDVYAAVSTQVTTGLLAGTVTADGQPLAQATVTITTATGVPLTTTTNANGRFQATLKPGSYSLRADAFGHEPATIPSVAVTANLTTTQNMALNPLPAGIITGRVLAQDGLQPLTATITVPGTPITAATNADGRYTLTLPTGQYKPLAHAHGHRLGRATVLVQPQQTINQNYYLDAAPTMLLVDGGKWYSQSVIDYYQNSLGSLNYTFDTWTVRDPYQDRPELTDLAPYDIVIWSSPSDSPGYIGAGVTISNYLGIGGNLLVSGQNVASLDGYGTFVEPWWYRLLQADFTGKTAVTHTLTGAPNTHFQNLNFSLNGGSSANNQYALDTSAPRRLALTQPILHLANEEAVTENDRYAGLQSGRCTPYRLVYLGIGLEGVRDAVDRADLLQRSLEYFQSPRAESDILWHTDPVADFALPGQQLVYTLTLRNLSEFYTDTIRLALPESDWPATLERSSLTMGPCETDEAVLTIDVPSDAPLDTTHAVTLTAVSGLNPAVRAPLSIHHKTPGQILLVDDDRWYDQQPIYREMLDRMNLRYDVWETGVNNRGRGSPPVDLLNYYDFVIWYTAYDWFQPITPEENQTLTQYLDQGGRLFLSSQDFLYYHRYTPLASTYLGVSRYREGITSTVMYGTDSSIFSPTMAGPLALDFTPYQNHSDGISPGAQSVPLAWYDSAAPGAIGTAGIGWRTVFWGVPLEKLPPATRSVALSGSISWLSDLGDSTFTVDRRAGALGQPRTYTITLHNVAGSAANEVTLTNTLPADLVIDPATVTGGAIYDPEQRQIRWNGRLPASNHHQISYQAAPASGLLPGTRLDNVVAIHYARHDLTVKRYAPLWIGAPDLGSSTLTATGNGMLQADHITLTLRLHNNGPATADSISTTLYLPPQSCQNDNRLFPPSAGVLDSDACAVRWQGSLETGEITTLTTSFIQTRTVRLDSIAATAVIDDQVTGPIVRYKQDPSWPHVYYFPLFAQAGHFQVRFSLSDHER